MLHLTDRFALGNSMRTKRMQIPQFRIRHGVSFLASILEYWIAAWRGSGERHVQDWTMFTHPNKYFYTIFTYMKLLQLIKLLTRLHSQWHRAFNFLLKTQRSEIQFPNYWNYVIYFKSKALRVIVCKGVCNNCTVRRWRDKYTQQRWEIECVTMYWLQLLAYRLKFEQNVSKWW